MLCHAQNSPKSGSVTYNPFSKLMRAVFLCCRKLTGMAFRVPVADVSVVDLTVTLGKEVSAILKHQ